jgi:hypothetical protein
VVADDGAHGGLGQHLEGVRVAEEAGDGDQQFASQGRQLAPVGAQQPHIVEQVRGLAHLHPALHAPHHGGRFVLAEIDAARVLQQVHDFFMRAVAVDLHRHRRRAHLGLGTLVDVVEQTRPDLLGRQDGVDQTGGDDAARHAVELGRLRILGHQETAGVVDGHRTARAVRAGAGEDDADGVIAELLGQRTEEQIDRQGQPTRVLRTQAQHVAADGHQTRRRDQMHPIGLDAHVVLDRHHRHGRVTREQIAHHALMVGRQMLDDDIGRPRICRQSLEEPLQGIEPPGRGADGHHIAIESTGDRYLITLSRRFRVAGHTTRLLSAVRVEPHSR